MSRATYLDFRNPKEVTNALYYPKVSTKTSTQRS